jgi:dienelactone hydrolase
MRRFTMNVLALCLVCSLSACGLVEFVRCGKNGKDLTFDVKIEPCLKNNEDGFNAKSVTHPVYCLPSQGTEKPPILLLHELPGLSGKTLDYARELSKDFTVYVPLLFGSVPMHSTPRGLAAFWLNGEWWGLESGTSDIVTWLGALVSEIERAHPGQQIGVIGNCLTGPLPLTLLNKKSIHAVVLAQPTLPLSIFRNDDKVKASLGISENEIEQAKNSSAKIFYVRFEQDCVSKREKLKTVQDIFTEQGKVPDRVHKWEIRYDKHPVEHAHSTLIGEWRDGESGKASRDAREEVRRFLRDPANFKPSHEP